MTTKGYEQNKPVLGTAIVLPAGYRCAKCRYRSGAAVALVAAAVAAWGQNGSVLLNRDAAKLTEPAAREGGCGDYGPWGWLSVGVNRRGARVV